VPLDPDLVAAMLVPLLAFGVWSGLRKLRRKIHLAST